MTVTPDAGRPTPAQLEALLNVARIDLRDVYWGREHRGIFDRNMNQWTEYERQRGEDARRCALCGVHVDEGWQRVLADMVICYRHVDYQEGAAPPVSASQTRETGTSAIAWRPVGPPEAASVPPDGSGPDGVAARAALDVWAMSTVAVLRWAMGQIALGREVQGWRVTLTRRIEELEDEGRDDQSTCLIAMRDALERAALRAGVKLGS